MQNEPTTEPSAEPTTQQRPPGPAPALDSVRWGPDTRDVADTWEQLDALAREHLGQPARVAGRFRARHNRDRVSLAIVASVDTRYVDVEGYVPEEMIGFGRLEPRESENEARPGLDRRPMGNDRDDLCRCAGEGEVQLHLLRIVHASTPQIASAELTKICSGLAFDARLLDFDGDGRVEVRVDYTFTEWESCGINSRETTRMAVFDIADLRKQVDFIVNDYEVAYEDDRRRETRIRFRDLDEDGDKDIEVRGIVSNIESHEEERFSVNERWLYDAILDVWSGPQRQ